MGLGLVGQPVNNIGDELVRVIQSAMPGWVFLTGPDAFGWAPDRHFRAQLTPGKTERLRWLSDALRVP